MNYNTKEKVLSEISNIDELLSKGKPTIEKCRVNIPDFERLSAVANMLQSFYQGIENILKMIFKDYDEDFAKTSDWHITLLDNAFVSTENRNPIFQKEIYKTLDGYLKFRHLNRNVYSHNLERSRMDNLVLNLESNWQNIKSDIITFINQNQEGKCI